MNTDMLAGKWDQIKGSLKKMWGDLTDQDLEKMQGGLEQSIGYLQEKYGETKEAIEEKLSNFAERFEEGEDADEDEDEDEDEEDYE